MTKRNVLTDYFKSFDGTELFYRTWEPVTENNSKKAMIVLHRGHEHSGRLHDIVDKMDLPDYYAFGYDGRGHGESPGPRGYAKSFSAMVKDLDTFVKFVSTKHDIPIQNIVIVANSVAGVLTSTWVHDYAPNIRAMILAAPAFKIKLYIPFAMAGLRLLNKIRKPSFISSYVKPKMLTHDEEQADAYQNDPLITRDIAVNVILDLFDTSERIIKDAGAITVPTCIVSAGKDWVVDLGPQRDFFNNLSSKKKEMEVYDGFFHGVFFEKDRIKPIQKARKFILECFTEDQKVASLLDAHQEGYTKSEYEYLKNDIGQGKSLFFKTQNAMMFSLGRLSKGIRIGLKTGFDSGLSLDHVYKNRATGFSPIGKLIDRVYLEAIGWRGIRQRKINIQESIENAILKLLEKGKPVYIRDIAAGPGRYLIEMAKKYEDKDVQAQVCDHDPRNIEEGKRIAKELNCKNVSFKLRDAFDESEKKGDDYKPNILIISGLYELFPSNDMVKLSLETASANLDKDGYVIYTGQPWHPQLEMISFLPNREGQRWIMRRRTQREMDQLVASIGFQKSDMKIDNWGIFTVSTASGE